MVLMSKYIKNIWYDRIRNTHVNDKKYWIEWIYWSSVNCLPSCSEWYDLSSFEDDTSLANLQN